MRHVLLLMMAAAVVVVGGCATGEPAGEPPEVGVSEGPKIPPDPPEDPEQGRFVLGREPDGREPNLPYYFHVAPAAVTIAISDPHYGYTVEATADGLLSATRTGFPSYTGLHDWFVGLVLEHPTRGRVRISGIDAAAGGYLLEDPVSLAPYCGAEPGGAIAVSGRYSRAAMREDTRSVTFICGDGVPRKCLRWGYPPGLGGPAAPNDPANDWDRYQACVGMAGARVCGDGVSYTREKTRIRIRDFIAGAQPNAMSSPLALPAEETVEPRDLGDPDEFYFEAGWDRRGRAICLSRRRWVSLPAAPCDGTPNAALTHPVPWYDDNDNDNPHAPAFCEDLSMTELLDRGAVLLNGSRMNDAALHIWNGPNNDTVASLHGYYDRSAPADTVEPWTGYTHPTNGVIAIVIRNLPGSLDAALDMNTLRLFREKVTRELVVGITAPTGNYDDLGIEAYTFKAPRPGASLELFQCQAGNGYTVQTASCGAAASLGFALPVPPQSPVPPP